VYRSKPVISLRIDAYVIEAIARMSGSPCALATQDTRSLLLSLTPRAKARVSVSLTVIFALLCGAGAGGLVVAHRPASYADAVKAGYRAAQDTSAPTAVQDPQKRLQAWIVGSAPLSAAAQPATLLASRADLDCLADAVYYEARGESVEGQAAVAQVVLNRTRQPGYPKGVCGVVFQSSRGGCQFSFTCDGAMSRPVELTAWDRARVVAARALSGYVMTAVGSAVRFHATHGRWQDGAVARIGGHVFLGNQPAAPLAHVDLASRDGARYLAANAAPVASKIATAMEKDYPEAPAAPERSAD